MGNTARLFYDDSETDADLYYLTGFLAGDPFLYVEVGGKKALYLSDLEVDRGRSQGSVDEVHRLESVVQAVKADGIEIPKDPSARMALYISRIARDRDIALCEVPPTFPVALADQLRARGVAVQWRPAPFLPERTRKSAKEVASIRRAIAHAEAAMRAAIDRIAAGRIRGRRIYEGSQPLTSEKVRFTIQGVLLERNCHGYDPIVAGGDQGCDPHERGHGPLPAHLPILLDIFPRDLSTRYHGDITRTVVRGRASGAVKKMFAAVSEAKSAAEALLRDGVDGFDVHAAVQKVFSDAGYRTGVEKGRMVGFFHGTGHGLGLDVHEYPRVGAVHETIRKGHVVTVEPGLYYPGIGGVRLEDDVFVDRRGSRNLGSMEAVLEV